MKLAFKSGEKRLDANFNSEKNKAVLLA